MNRPDLADRPASCPVCTTFRVRTVPWNVRSRPGDAHADGVTVWECFSCGHVWRKAGPVAEVRGARVA